MANTTNFNWATPDDTDLVKDGAAAIRTLGSSIDTSLVDLLGGTTGQVLSKTSGTDMDFTWVDTDDANAIQNAIVDAKGDLIAASANDTPARLAVGNNGETLVADSAASTGLAWAGNYAAAKNKLINGDFAINQRNFSSTTTNGDYGFDRWAMALSGGTATYSAQTFTLGAAPVAGYEAKNFARLTVTTGNDLCRLQQLIESVRTFAGQTVTLSFWAKGTNPTTTGNLSARLQQVFGTGGSPSANVSTADQTFVLTANWTRYSFTFSVPSISGKTIGTDNNDTLGVWIGQGASVSTDAWTLDLWGVQLEAGSVATAFQTATGTLQGELAACQRYYYQTTPLANKIFTTGQAYSTTAAYGAYQNPVTMRGVPSVSFSAAGDFDLFNATGSRLAVTALAGNAPNVDNIRLDATVASGLVAGNGTVYIDDAGGNAVIKVSAEL